MLEDRGSEDNGKGIAKKSQGISGLAIYFVVVLAEVQIDYW
jgi:hypothetical protein